MLTKIVRLLSSLKTKTKKLWKYTLTKVKTDSVYTVTERELSDTIKDCYRKGLSDSQILEVLNSPPYKWESAINCMVDYNREKMNEIFETNSYDDYTDSYSYVSTVSTETAALVSPDGQSCYNEKPDIDNSEKEFVSYLINSFCCSDELVKILSAKYPQHAEKIRAYMELNNIIALSIPKKDGEKGLKRIHSVNGEDYEMLRQIVNRKSSRKSDVVVKNIQKSI